MGTFLRSYVKVLKPIELSFGVVSVVGQVMGVLKAGPHILKGREGIWGLLPPLF